MKILVSLLCFLTWGTLLHAQGDTIAEHYKTPSYDCAIFSAAFKGDSSLDTFLPNRFTPSHAEVDMVETKIKKKIHEIDSISYPRYDFPEIITHLKGYERQYFGYTDSSGHRIIYVNSFLLYASEKGKGRYEVSFRKRLFRVFGGGWRYWQAYFDLNAEKFICIYINDHYA